MNVRNMANNIEYPVFDQATRQNVIDLKSELVNLSHPTQLVIGRLMAMPPMIRLRRNIISAIDQWISHPYVTVVPDGLHPSELCVLSEAPSLTAGAQVALHALYNLHDRQEFIGRMLPILNRYRSAHE